MEVVRLGERYTSQYVPDMLLEGYRSCIWTERYSDFGEFEIRTPEIDKYREILPEGTLISHLDTYEVMEVETHNVVTDETGNKELVIKGRDLRTIFEHRIIASQYKKKRLMRRNYPASGGLGVLLWHAVVNASGKDVTRGTADSTWNAPENATDWNDYNWTTLDKIPNVVITDSVPTGGNSFRWWLEAGVLYPQVQAMLIKHKIGLRTIRPHENSKGQVLTVRAYPIGERGQIDRTYTTGIEALRFDIYKGVDRSHSQSTNPKVAFSVLQGDLSRSDYLWSSKDLVTHVDILSSVSIGDRYASGTSGYAGFRRRSETFDAGEPELPPQPEAPDKPRKNATKQEKDKYEDDYDKYIERRNRWRNKRNSILQEFKEDAIEDALKVIETNKRVVMLSGDVSPLSPYVYKTHYDLGDLVSLHGDYGLQEKMMVSEYIRTEDENGDNGYPGLVMP